MVLVGHSSVYLSFLRYVHVLLPCDSGFRCIYLYLQSLMCICLLISVLAGGVRNDVTGAILLHTIQQLLLILGDDNNHFCHGGFSRRLL